MRLFGLILAFFAPALAAQAADRFTVEVRGKGPDVILIPGLASSRAVWDDTARALEARYRVHVVQVNGFAGAPAGANAQGPVVPGLVEDLAAYIADRKLGKPAVIGHSMGGFSALKLAVEHPDRVGRVMVVDALPFFSVLINPSATAQSVEPQAAGIRQTILTMSEADLAKAQAQTMQRLVKGEADRRTTTAWALASDRRVVGQATYDIMTSDLRGALASIAVPVTVLYAKDDSMGFVGAYVDGFYRDNYQALPGVRLVRVDGALHFIMLDQPEKFQAEVEAFLK
ncbi:MAG TPA: alpha/beta hydrolase [Caulobacter sp.]|nr:alpha/beta hydrolase [Caulobacter sp.]